MPAQSEVTETISAVGFAPLIMLYFQMATLAVIINAVCLKKNRRNKCTALLSKARFSEVATE